MPPVRQFCARPLLIYPKPRKTGSTFIASKLGMSVLHAGGRVAPCEVAALMTPDAEYYGLVGRYDLLGCHQDLGRISVEALSRTGREVVFVTSIREPVGWFLSAAVWVYEKSSGEVVKDETKLREAVDGALKGGVEFAEFRRLFWGNYGLKGNESRMEVRGVANIFRYVFDHGRAEEDVDEALMEMGYVARGASLRREGVYEEGWWGGYRKGDIESLLGIERLIYEELGRMRKARRGEMVPWVKVGGVVGAEAEVVYSATRNEWKRDRKTKGRG